MRWDGQGIEVDDGALPGLERIGFVRSVQTPQFAGITFHEVLCKSALNKIPDAAALPFKFTVNGYRGCSHACRYCFARPTHEIAAKITLPRWPTEFNRQSTQALADDALEDGLITKKADVAALLP